MFGLHGKMIAQPGQRDALLKILMNAATDGMPGCLMYVISTANDDPDGLWVTEIWRSQADHRASLDLDSVKTLIAAARPLIAGFSDRSEFTPLGGIGMPESKAP